MLRISYQLHAIGLKYLDKAKKILNNAIEEMISNQAAKKEIKNNFPVSGLKGFCVSHGQTCSMKMHITCPLNKQVLTSSSGFGQLWSGPACCERFTFHSAQ